MNYGRALMAAGRIQEAEPALREAVRLGPNYSYAHINLGVLLNAQRKPAEATKLMDRAIELAPNLVYAHYQRGLLSERLNEPVDKRIQYFKRATELSPNHADAQYQLGRSLALARKPELAEAPARAAVSLRGAYADRFLLTYVLLQRGAAKEAEPVLLGLQRERANDQQVAYNLNYARKLMARGATR
jgi:tetratricopeptide (TPR) repeat protein